MGRLEGRKDAVHYTHLMGQNEPMIAHSGITDVGNANHLDYSCSVQCCGHLIIKFMS